jgi:lipoteichoic acid synthase
LIWGKLVYLSLFLTSEWWANEPSIGRWMRSTEQFLGAIQDQPYIASATLASLLIIGAPLMLASRGRRLGLLILLNLALTVVGLADLLHVRFYADVLSASSFTTARMIRDVLPSLGDIFLPTDPLYAVDIALALLLLPRYRDVCRRIPGFGFASRARLATGLLIAGLLFAEPTLRLAWDQDQGLFSRSTLRVEAAAVTGLLPYHLLDASIGMLSRRSIGEPEIERVRQFLEQEQLRKGAPSELFGVARGTNVILMSMESLQAFPIGLQINGQPVTPRLSAFAAESLSFVNFHDQTYLGTTSDAQFAALNSLHPQPVGFVAMNYAENDFRALPAILLDHGYATLAAEAAPGEFWNAKRLHPRYGIQRSIFEGEYVLSELIGPWLSDREFFAQTLPFLQEQPSPVMAFLFSSSNHHPYDLPASEQILDVGALEGTLLGSYLHSVHYFDRAFGELIDNLRAVRLLDQTMVVVYGDHQGFLGDPPELASLLGLSQWGEYERFKIRKKVPFFIRLPHGAHASVREVAAGHLDIAPTILSLLGIVDEGATMLGRDLTRQRDSLVVFRDGSFADGYHYLVQRLGSLGPACYEAASGRSVDCALLEARRREARERLEVSDLIVQGNLIPSLREGASAAPANNSTGE